MRPILLIRRWWKRVTLGSVTLLGVYLATYLWARQSGRLWMCSNDNYLEGLEPDGSTATYWAPGGICPAPPYPVGTRNRANIFRPAMEMELRMPDWITDMIRPSVRGPLHFAGNFIGDEAATYVRLLLGRRPPAKAGFLGGEFDSQRGFAVVRYSASLTEFETWIKSLPDQAEFAVSTPLHYEKYNWGFIRENKWTNQPARLSVWWNNCQLTVREDYGLNYLPDWDRDKLEP